MNAQDERRTEQLRAYVNDPKNTDIVNIEEDDMHLYFSCTQIDHPMLLRAMGYETWIQERQKTQDYRVKILKPNWFSHNLEVEAYM